MSLIHEEGHCKPVLCDNLEGQSGEGGGRGFQDGGDTSIPMFDSYSHMAKTITTLQSNYPPIKIIFLKSRERIRFFD